MTDQKQQPLQEALIAARLMETAMDAQAPAKRDYTAVEAAFQSILAEHSERPEPGNAYADFLWRRGRFDDAQQQWQETLRRFPNHPEAAFQLGSCALQLGQTRAALKYLRRAVESGPENARHHFAYANALYLFRRDAPEPDPEKSLRAALAHFQQAAALDPGNVEFARAYAETFYALRDPDWTVALEAWRRVETLSPQKDFARLNLARVHLKLGQKQQAAAVLESVQSARHQGLKKTLQRQTESK